MEEILKQLSYNSTIVDIDVAQAIRSALDLCYNSTIVDIGKMENKKIVADNVAIIPLLWI